MRMMQSVKNPKKAMLIIGVLFILFVQPLGATVVLENTLTVLPEYKVLSPGSQIQVKLIIKKSQDHERIIAQVIYGIKDAKGWTQELHHESLTIENESMIMHSFVLPATIAPGEYAFYANILYPGAEQYKTDEIRVVGRPRSFVEQYGKVIVVLAMLPFILILGYCLIQIRKIFRE